MPFALFEALDTGRFLIEIPGFPISLGRFCFIVSGVFCLLFRRGFLLNSRLLFGIIFIYLGIFISSIIDGSGLNEILGVILLAIGSVGNVYLWYNPKFRRLMPIFFIISLIYWLGFSFSNTVFKLLSYSELGNDLVNHHVPGLLISISATYVSILYFYKKNTFKTGGYLVLSSAIVACLFIESRSNAGFCLLIMIYISSMGKRVGFGRLFKAAPILILIVYILFAFIGSKESLTRRFTFDGGDYQKRTTNTRIELIEISITEFSKSPILGKGIENTSVDYNRNYIMLHNQFLTFIMGGGMITLIGVVLFLVSFLKIAFESRSLLQNMKQEKIKILIASVTTCIVFFSTLLTIENGGILFYLILSLAISSEVTLKKLTRKRTN